MAFDAQEVRRPLHLVIYFSARANVPFVIRVTEFADQREMRRLRAADFVALLAVIHIREVLASARVGPHPVTLKASRVSLFDGEFILTGVRFLDSLMTIGAPGGLARGEPGWRKVRGPGGDRLELEAFWKRLPVRNMRKVYAEVASQESVKSVGLLFEVVQSRGRF